VSKFNIPRRLDARVDLLHPFEHYYFNNVPMKVRSALDQLRQR
jgi:hypothetical protein